ncbi:MAG TPA: radical SAM protein, partial [Candidatus Polarisedimenticolia bacterium]|nr:radical SAM protein [Candidatus Polarisedimenticolia bacterium]
WIHATLRQDGFDCSLANLSRASWARIDALLRREKPDLVGVTLYTFNRHAGLRLAAMARRANPRCTVVAGGPHATHVAGSILAHYPAVSAVAVGEGEITMLEVARALWDGSDLSSVAGLVLRGPSGGAARTRPRAVVADLDSLPFPAPWYAGRHLDPEAESSFVITSRGCPARCTFCNTPDFWGTRMRFRSPESMVDEMRYLRDALGILHVSIRDDTFTVNKRRVIEFCRRLIDERLGILWNCQSRVNAIDEERLAWMRRAGCDHIQYGIESGSPRILKRLAKDITIDQIHQAAAATRRVGLTLSIYLISGVPGESREDFEATEELVERIRPHDGLVAPLAIFPGTSLYEEMKAAGSIDDDFWVRERKDTLYALTGAPARASFGRLTRLCERVGRGAAYTREELDRHTKALPGAFAAWIASADARELEGDFGAALADYQEILRFAPDNVWARIRIGRLLARTGDPASASIYLKQALAIVPRSRLVGEMLRSARQADRRGRPGRGRGVPGRSANWAPAGRARP